MKLSFRQGIVRYEQFQSPPILSQTSFGAESVDINVIEEPIVVTFAHHGANYIIEETNSIVAAWGSGGPNNAALAPGPVYYLYWEIDQATGALTRGWTTIPWVANSTEPVNPQVGLHWFDTTNTRMRVWKQTGSNPGYWQDVIRVFAGIFDGSTVTPYAIGSQVGLVGNFEGGNIILGVNNAPLRQADGSFVTTTTPLIIQQTSGQNVKFEAALVFGQAIEEIPAFYLVSFMPDRRVKLALSGNVDDCAVGITLEGLSEGEVGQIITSGVVQNDQWAWTDDQIGQALFLGPTGELWLTPPPGGIAQRIGEVYTADSINLNIQQPIRRDADPALLTGKMVVLQSDGTLAETAAGGGGTDTDDQTAAEVPITAIGALPGATNVQEALEQLSVDPTADEVSITPIAEFGAASNVQEALEAIASSGGAGPAINTCYGYAHDQLTPEMVWTIVHNGATTRASVTVYDDSMQQVIPDEVIIVDANTIEVYFNTPETGSAAVIMFATPPPDVGTALTFMFAFENDSALPTNLDPLYTSSTGLFSTPDLTASGGYDNGTVLSGYTVPYAGNGDIIARVGDSIFVGLKNSAVGTFPTYLAAYAFDNATGIGALRGTPIETTPDGVQSYSPLVTKGTGSLVFAMADNTDEPILPLRFFAAQVNGGNLEQVGNIYQAVVEGFGSRAGNGRILQMYDGHLCLITAAAAFGASPNLAFRSLSFDGTTFTPVVNETRTITDLGTFATIDMVCDEYFAALGGTILHFYRYTAVGGLVDEFTFDLTTLPGASLQNSFDDLVMDRANGEIHVSFYDAGYTTSAKHVIKPNFNTLTVDVIAVVDPCPEILAYPTRIYDRNLLVDDYTSKAFLYVFDGTSYSVLPNSFTYGGAGLGDAKIIPLA